MSETTKKMVFYVVSKRVNFEGSSAYYKNASISLDTNLKGNPDAFNPAELLLAAVSACMIKGIERVTPFLKFELYGIEVFNQLKLRIEQELLPCPHAAHVAFHF